MFDWAEGLFGNPALRWLSQSRAAEIPGLYGNAAPMALPPGMNQQAAGMFDSLQPMPDPMAPQGAVVSPAPTQVDNTTAPGGWFPTWETPSQWDTETMQKALKMLAPTVTNNADAGPRVPMAPAGGIHRMQLGQLQFLPGYGLLRR